MNIVHTYVDNMYIDQNDENKHSFAQKWGLVSLANRGHNVTLLCGSRTNKRQEFVWNNIKVIQLPSLINITNSTRILKGFNQQLQKLQPDIIHTHHYASFIPELSLIHAKIRKIPIVLTIHNSFTEGPLLMKLLATVYLAVMQPFLPFYNRTTFISKYLQNKWRFIMLKSKSSVIYNQIPIPEFINDYQNKNSVNQNILYIGRLSHQKGVDILIRAINLVKHQFPNIKLKILGTGSSKYTNKLKNIIHQLQIQDSVEFLGYKRGIEKQQILSQSSMMVIPSRIEALLNKIPLIISNNAALPEAANGFAKIFKNNHPADLAKTIIETINLHNTNEQKDSIEMAYNYAKKFTTNQIAIDLEQVYNSLL
jgi:glycosyltransferase involved in cell wall biosynthesis